MSAPTRAERIEAGRARAEERQARVLSPVQRWTLAALLVAMLAVAFWALRSGFSNPLLSTDDLTNRLINPERVAYEAATQEIVLAHRTREYRIAEPLWRGYGEGAALAAAIPSGQAVMLWVPRADTSAPRQTAMAVEAAALTVPVGAGLRAMQSSARANRWTGIAALLLALYAGFLLFTRRRSLSP